MARSKKMVEKKCPYCKNSTGQINNHIRMSKGDGHAPTGEYPEDWDNGNRIRRGSSGEPIDQDEPELEAGETDLDLDDEPEPEPDRDQTEKIGFSDSLDQAREYECENCSEEIPYLGGDDRNGGGKECPNCNERLFWSMIDQ